MELYLCDYIQIKDIITNDLGYDALWGFLNQCDKPDDGEPTYNTYSINNIPNKYKQWIEQYMFYQENEELFYEILFDKLATIIHGDFECIMRPSSWEVNETNTWKTIIGIYDNDYTVSLDKLANELEKAFIKNNISCKINLEEFKGDTCICIQCNLIFSILQ